MNAPAGSPLYLVLEMAGVLGAVSETAVREAWERWIGPQRFHRKLQQFERMGWIERSGGSGDVERVIRLTDTGRAVALGGRDPEAQWRRTWDGCWRMVLFDVPESQSALRRQLGRRLRALGFGYLQGSVWISPDPVDALRKVVRGARIDVESLLFMEGRPCGGESHAQLVEGAWDFVKINRAYDLCLDLLWRMPNRGSRSRQAWLDAEHRAWTSALRMDPLLPRPLLPSNYRGEEAWRNRNETFRSLIKDL